MLRFRNCATSVTTLVLARTSSTITGSFNVLDCDSQFPHSIFDGKLSQSNIFSTQFEQPTYLHQAYWTTDSRKLSSHQHVSISRCIFLLLRSLITSGHSYKIPDVGAQGTHRTPHLKIQRSGLNRLIMDRKRKREWSHSVIGASGYMLT